MKENNDFKAEIIEEAENDSTIQKSTEAIGEKLGFLDKLTEKLAWARLVGTFAAILPTIAFILFNICLNHLTGTPELLQEIIAIILVVLYISGLIGAVLACPVRLLCTPFRWTGRGFELGLFIPGIGCFIGAAMGFIFGVAAILVVPALITIPQFLKSE